MLIVCIQCKVERKESDYLLGSCTCYKCQYTNKLKRVVKLRATKCKVCDAPLPENRWVYCSYECGQMGADHLKKNHWTMKIRVF